MIYDCEPLLKKERNIDKNVSSKIKGVLILLIILGHNSVLTQSKPEIISYLYSFHVILFFILPWFYINSNKPTLRKSIKRCVKLYSYYTLFFIIQVIGYNLLIESNFDLINCIRAFVVGGHYTLKAVTGYQYLWFMPAFCVSMLIHDIYVCVPINKRFYVNLIALIVVIIFTQLRYQDNNALIQGIFFAAISIVAIQVYNHIYKYINKMTSIVIFIIASILICIDFTYPYITPIMPFIAFFAIWDICSLYDKCSEWLVKLGSLSLLIYLIHPLVFQFLIRIIPCINSQLFFGGCLLILTIIISVVTSYVIDVVIIKRNWKRIIRGVFHTTS